MAISESTKKVKVKGKTIPTEIDDSGFCSDCMYYWCNLRGEIDYCSMKYRGAISFICRRTTKK